MQLRQKRQGAQTVGRDWRARAFPQQGLGVGLEVSGPPRKAKAEAGK
jgi:hypothetical protein